MAKNPTLIIKPSSLCLIVALKTNNFPLVLSIELSRTFVVM